MTDPSRYTVGQKVIVKANVFIKTQWTFSGWNTKADGTGTSYPEGASFTLGSSAVDLWAQWVVTNPFQNSTYDSTPAVWADPASGQFVRTSDSFQNGDLTTTLAIYQDDPSCSLEPQHVIDVVVAGTETVRWTAADTYEESRTIRSVTMTILTQAMVDWANTNGLLNIKDWSLGVPRHIEGITQGTGSGSMTIVAAGTLVSDVLSTKGSTYQRGRNTRALLTATSGPAPQAIDPTVTYSVRNGAAPSVLKSTVATRIGEAPKLLLPVLPPASTALTWTSKTPAVATVDADGTVHAVAMGTTEVSAQDSHGGRWGYFTVKVYLDATGQEAIGRIPAFFYIPLTEEKKAFYRTLIRDAYCDASFEGLNLGQPEGDVWRYSRDPGMAGMDTLCQQYTAAGTSYFLMMDPGTEKAFTVRTSVIDRDVWDSSECYGVPASNEFLVNGVRYQDFTFGRVQYGSDGTIVSFQKNTALPNPYLCAPGYNNATLSWDSGGTYSWQYNCDQLGIASNRVLPGYRLPDALGLTMRVTLDGTDPTTSSPVLPSDKTPVVIPNGVPVCVKARSFDSAGNASPIAVRWLINTPPRTDNRLQNGDFALGQYYWNYAGQKSSGSVANGSMDLHLNTASADISDASFNHWNSVSLFQFASYRLTFKAWASAPRTIKAFIRETGRDVNNDGASDSILQAQTFNLTGSAQSFTWDLTMTNILAEKGHLDGWFGYLVGGEAGDVFFDDIVFVPTGPENLGQVSVTAE